jgi:PAS domain S-box-containing protein
MLGLPLSAFVKEVDPEQLASYMQRRHRGLWEQIEYLMPRKDGSYIWVLTSNNPFFDPQGNYQGALSMFSDITYMKEIEKQLREREEQYRSIFEATTDAMFIVDLANGDIKEVNRAGCLLYRYSRQELLEKPDAPLTRSGYKPSFWNNLGTTRTGQLYKTIVTDIRKDGTEFMAEVFAVDFLYQGRSHILAVVRDVTEREQAYHFLEQKVEERTRELSTLLDFSKEVVSNLELYPLLDNTLDQLGRLVEFDGVSVLARQSILDESEQATGDKGETNSFKIVAYRGPLPQKVVLEQSQLVLNLDFIQKALLHAQRTPLPFIASDLTRILEEHHEEGLDGETRQAINSYFSHLPYARAWMVIPMVVKERVVGLISLTYSQPGYYTLAHARTISILANHLGIALENLRLNKQAKTLAVLEERQRLARDLHDSVVQILYSIGLSTNTALSYLEAREESDPFLLKAVEDTLSLTEGGLDEMRALIFELRPESLEVEGLVSALQKQATALQSRHKLEIELDLPAEEPVLPWQVKDNLYRIAQEALHNVVKHARAKRVALRLYRDSDDNTILEIRDDGRGFDPTAPFPGHLGLRSMEERASRIGGQFSLESSPGQGTGVQVGLRKVSS